GGAVVREGTKAGALDGYKAAAPRPAAWEVHHNVPPEWSAVPQQSLIEIVAKGCLEDPWRPALIIEDGLTITRRELLDRCQRFAGYLRSRLSPGDNVTVMLDNRVEFMIVLFAIIANRATLVPIAPAAQAFDAGHIVADAAPVLAICGKPQLPVMEAVKARAPALTEIIVVDGEEPDGLAAYDAAPFDFTQAECR